MGSRVRAADAAPTDDGLLLDTISAARYVGLSPHMMVRLRSTSEGARFKRIGQLVYYARVDLDRWVASLPTFQRTAEGQPGRRPPRPGRPRRVAAVDPNAAAPNADGGRSRRVRARPGGTLMRYVRLLLALMSPPEPDHSHQVEATHPSLFLEVEYPREVPLKARGELAELIRVRRRERVARKVVRTEGNIW